MNKSTLVYLFHFPLLMNHYIFMPEDAQLQKIHSLILAELEGKTPCTEDKALKTKYTNYYTWKLYSLQNKETLDEWAMDPLKIGNSIYYPPAAPFPSIHYKKNHQESIFAYHSSDSDSDEVKRRKLSPQKEFHLTTLILEMKNKKEIGDTMVFCIRNSKYANEIFNIIKQSLASKNLDEVQARLFLLNDLLFNEHSYLDSWKYKHLIEQEFNRILEMILNVFGVREVVDQLLDVWFKKKIFSPEFIFRARQAVFEHGKSKRNLVLDKNGDSNISETNLKDEGLNEKFRPISSVNMPDLKRKPDVCQLATSEGDSKIKFKLGGIGLTKRKKLISGLGSKVTLPLANDSQKFSASGIGNSKNNEVEPTIVSTKAVKEGISFVDSSKDIFGDGIEMEFKEFLEYDYEKDEVPNPELDGMCLDLYFRELGYRDSEEEDSSSKGDEVKQEIVEIDQDKDKLEKDNEFIKESEERVIKSPIVDEIVDMFN